MHRRPSAGFASLLLAAAGLTVAGSAARAGGFADQLAAEGAAPSGERLTLQELLPRNSHFGKRPLGMTWSHDDRYLAYRWNPYEDRVSDPKNASPGSRTYDLWLYDTQNGKSRRVTSVDMMSAFDRELAPIAERYKKEKEELARRKTLSREERLKLDDEDRKKDFERKEPLKEYAGIQDVEWAKTRHELLFTYQGDIFRWRVDDSKPTRLTRTKETENAVHYSRDDSGFFFRRGTGVFRMRFDSPVTEQLNPDLPNNLPLQGYWLSPDESKLLISTGRNTAPVKEVSYITYRDRFAQAKTAPRTAADEVYTVENYLFIHDLRDDQDLDQPGDRDPKKDGKPWQVAHLPAGGDYGTFVLDREPWSPDGRKVAFATWKRASKEVEFFTAEAESRKLSSLYKTLHQGEHTTPTLADPKWTKDGSKLVVMLEQSGYRHAWLIDPLNPGATQLTRGDFEVYPSQVAKDGTLFAYSNREHPARMDLYRVDLTEGAMTRLTGKAGRYLVPELNHDGKRAATVYSAWNSPAELTLVSTVEKGDEQAITASHAGTLDAVAKLKPELFSYRNRNGQTVHGFMFKPKGWQKSDKRPLLIYVYGGPLSTDKSVVDGAFSADSFFFNLWTAHELGYVTVTIDPRGQSGYGSAFGSANFDQPGKAQVEDLTDGAKHLIENYGVDPKKVGVYGWSFGGFQTQMCLYTAPEVFTLGIAGAGPTEWQNYNSWYVGGVIGKSKKPEELDQYSLTKLAKNLKSPLMLVHGMEDTNVLFQDTIKVYRELLRSGKGPLVELVIDPTGDHGLGGDIRTRDRLEIYATFLKKWWGPYAGGGTGTAAAR